MNKHICIILLACFSTLLASSHTILEELLVYAQQNPRYMRIHEQLAHSFEMETEPHIAVYSQFLQYAEKPCSVDAIITLVLTVVEQVNQGNTNLPHIAHHMVKALEKSEVLGASIHEQQKTLPADNTKNSSSWNIITLAVTVTAIAGTISALLYLGKNQTISKILRLLFGSSNANTQSLTIHLVNNTEHGVQAHSSAPTTISEPGESASSTTQFHEPGSYSESTEQSIFERIGEKGENFLDSWARRPRHTFHRKTTHTQSSTQQPQSPPIMGIPLVLESRIPHGHSRGQAAAIKKSAEREVAQTTTCTNHEQMSSSGDSLIEQVATEVTREGLREGLRYGLKKASKIYHEHCKQQEMTKLLDGYTQTIEALLASVSASDLPSRDSLELQRLLRSTVKEVSANKYPHARKNIAEAAVLINEKCCKSDNETKLFAVSLRKIDEYLELLASRSSASM